MRLKDIGLTFAMLGFFGGQLLSTLLMRQVYAISQSPSAGNLDPASLASAIARSYNCTLGGTVLSLVGVLIFVVGSLQRPRV